LVPGTQRTVCVSNRSDLSGMPPKDSLKNYYYNIRVTEAKADTFGSLAANKCYTITILPTVIIENLLIQPLLYRLYRTGETSPFREVWV
jgi:hypothetical protein